MPVTANTGTHSAKPILGQLSQKNKGLVFNEKKYRTPSLLLWKYLNKQYDKLASLRLMSGNLNFNANEKFARQERG